MRQPYLQSYSLKQKSCYLLCNIHNITYTGYEIVKGWCRLVQFLINLNADFNNFTVFNNLNPRSILFGEEVICFTCGT